MIRKLHIGSTLAALFLFFLPWIDLRCSGQSVATQTGMQTIYGGHTQAPGESPLSVTLEERRKGSEPGEEMGHAPLVALALIVVVAAAMASFVLGQRSQVVGMLCAIALALIALQMMIGFPVKKRLAEQMAQTMTFPGRLMGPDHQMDETERKMTEDMMETLEIRHLPALYFELILLGVPTLLLASGWIEKMKKRVG